MNFNIDLKNIDLKNISLEDIQTKLKKVEKKTWIKIGIAFGAVVFFLIIYYGILNPIVNKKKAQLLDMNQKISVIIHQLDDFREERREEREKFLNVSNDTKQVLSDWPTTPMKFMSGMIVTLNQQKGTQVCDRGKSGTKWLKSTQNVL